MLVSVVIWFCSFWLLSIEACKPAHLKGSIRACFTSDGVLIPQIPTIAQNGTNCLVETDTELQPYVCETNEWRFDQFEGKRITSGSRRHKRGFWRSVGNFVTGVVKTVTCVATRISCLWDGRSGPPPDITPPVINCSRPLIVAFAEPFQTYAKVSWIEPTAHDNKDGNVRVRREGGRPPGRHFPEGVWTIKYNARDRRGNRAKTCLKTIKVIVKRCPLPKPISNGFYLCHPSTDVVLEGWCRFGCYDGFELHGESLITCLDDNKWSADQPICKAWTCPEPPSIPGASFPKCSNGNRFRSICTYNCKTGFDMPPKVSKTMVCSIKKTWRQFGAPKCIDIEPPEFESCPSSKVYGTDRGSNTSLVVWNEPKVRDNSGPGIRPMLKTVYHPGSRLTAGIYDVEYTATDSNGNEARACKFKAIVRDVRCPKLYPTPYVKMVCPDGYRTGSGCNIACDADKTIKGSTYVTCEESNEKTYGYWNWNQKQQTTCISTHHCQTIPAPNNGAVVCDNWSGGQFCQLQCRNGTLMSGFNWRKLFVCSSYGSWFPNKPHVRPCTKTRRSINVMTVAASYFFYGDCSDEKTKSSIAQNFIQVIKSSDFGVEGCNSQDQCNKDNVMTDIKFWRCDLPEVAIQVYFEIPERQNVANIQVRCGIQSRTKRDVDNITSVTAMNLSIHFNIPIAENNVYNQDFVTTLINNASKICTDDIANIFGSFRAKVSEVKSLGTDVVCKEGHVKVENTLSCVECPPGTYFSRSTSKCISCPKGTYQDRGGQSACQRCPYGTTSTNNGASLIDECQDACPPGTYSADGVVPCSPCEIGQYQPSYGHQNCRHCTGTTTTLTIGTSRRSECDEFDIQLQETGRKLGKLSLPTTQLFGDFVLSFWFRQDEKGTTEEHNGFKFTFLDQENNTVWYMHSFRFVERGNRQDTYLSTGLSDTRWHNIRIEYRSCNMSAYLDGILVQSNSSPGTCVPIGIKEIMLEAGDGFGGSLSQMNIWNGTGFIPSSSKCFSQRKTPTLSWQQFGNTELTNAYIHLPSSCDDHDNCMSSPCLNGNCTDKLHGFHCDCNRGFTGERCEVNIDDCEVNICMNNATCVDEIDGYKCECLPSYTGTCCEIEMVDGGWSEWSNWTECSTTCGEAHSSRKRLCNNPTPDNGGQTCLGDSTDVKECNNTDCPVCLPLNAPGNGTIDCQNVSETVNCTITCDDGFDFDIQPLDYYICGPDTSYEWNIQSDDNPDGKLPRCSEIHMPERLTVHYSVNYRELLCSTNKFEREATTAIDSRIKAIVNSLPCVSSDTCSLDNLKVTDCTASRLRRRRVSSAGVALTISVQPTIDSANETMTMLQDAFTQLQESAENGNFTVDIMDDEYELDIDSLSLDGEVTCKPGSTRVQFYCVPCSRGSYAFDDYCKPCERGTYQDSEGQFDCLPCPSGTTTSGIGSADIQECAGCSCSAPSSTKSSAKASSKVPLNDIATGIKVTSIIVGSVCGVVVLSVAVLVYRRYRSGVRKKLVEPTDINLTSRPTSGMRRDPLGPSKPMFKLPRDPKNDTAQCATLPNIDG